MPAPMIGRHADEATREEIAAAIADLRARAKRYPLASRQRAQIDEEVDALVTDWIAAGA